MRKATNIYIKALPNYFGFMAYVRSRITLTIIGTKNISQNTLPVLLTVDTVPPGLTAKFWTCCTQIFWYGCISGATWKKSDMIWWDNYYIHKKKCAELNGHSLQGSAGLSNLFFYTDWLESKIDLGTMQIVKVINIIKHGHGKQSLQ